jgi:hypothetical protein
MDFNDFLAEYSEKYGLSEEDWNGLRKNVILSFREDENGKTMAWYKRIPVFRHKNSEKEISAGSTWICSLDMSKETYYFARGLQRVDASFMYELKRDQVEEIANIVWDRQKQVIEPILEDRYKGVMEERLRQAVSDTEGKYEEQLKLLRDSIHQLEQRDAENKKIIASLQEQKETAKRSEERIANETVLPINPADSLSLVKDTSVRREGPDTISSPFFSRSRYFVHLSADHRQLAIKQHESGNVICMDNTMVLAGLNLVSQYEGPCEMTSEYSPQYGGLKIYL